MDTYVIGTNLWCHSCMVLQLNLTIEFSLQLSPELDSMAGSNCGTIQLWHHSWTHVIEFIKFIKKNREIQLPKM